MPRKRKLDPFVTSFVDRHGKDRYRFRRAGLSFYLPAPGTKGYKEAYARGMEGFRPDPEPRSSPRSVHDLLTRFYRSNGFIKGGDKWRATVRAVLEPFREEFRDDKVADFDFDHIEVILARRAKQETTDRTRGGTFATKRLHEQLKRIFAFAIRLKWITNNPALDAELPVVHVVKGFYSWTERDIAKFQKHWPVGTMPRLAFEIALWTGLRRGDVAALGPHNLVGDRIVTSASKTGKAVNVLAVKPLLDAIAATEAGEQTFLVTSFGKPFTTSGFGAWFRERCDEAGLPQCTLHGLRKAIIRRAADLGASQQQLKAIGQWSGDAEVAVYAADANQIAMADSAIAAVAKWATESNGPEKVRQTDGVL